MKKRCQMGPPKSCFGFQNGAMGVPVSTYPLIFDVLARCQKTLFLDALPKVQTNRKIGSKIAERTPERPEDSAEVPGFGSRVPRPSTRATK